MGPGLNKWLFAIGYFLYIFVCAQVFLNTLNEQEIK